jgi:hypothetical protein
LEPNQSIFGRTRSREFPQKWWIFLLFVNGDFIIPILAAFRKLRKSGRNKREKGLEREKQKVQVRVGLQAQR